MQPVFIINNIFFVDNGNSLPIISTKSVPAITRKGTSDSAATALASNVLPQPGGPSNRAPRGILAPRFCQHYKIISNRWFTMYKN